VVGTGKVVVCLEDLDSMHMVVGMVEEDRSCDPVHD
jgi:hypothetical protein